MKNDTISIAYAEDHSAVRKSIISYLENLGGIQVVIEAENGSDLMKQLQQAAKWPDVIMLDIQMPQMDGFQTMEALKEKQPAVKTLALTAFETELYLVQMISMGINGYLLKNCHPHDIKQAVTDIHEYGYHFGNIAEERFFAQVQNGLIKLPHFSDHEMEYLKYSITDMSYKEIAIKMDTTVKALEGYMTRLCEKLHVKGRIGLAMCAIQFGIIDTNKQVKLPLNLKNKALINNYKPS